MGCTQDRSAPSGASRSTTALQPGDSSENSPTGSRCIRSTLAGEVPSSGGLSTGSTESPGKTLRPTLTQRA
jgi:hypothetical protein